MPKNKPLADIEIAHTVSLDNELLSEKFDYIGRIALLRVICGEDSRAVLDSLQVLRNYWMNQTDEKSIDIYSKRYL